ncbi:MAG: diacylglycerol kinase family lipid kinase [Firmicutes bacterium]|nr:diacylglycerol kinase family lipid kinase [Bacillota bacterium]
MKHIFILNPAAGNGYAEKVLQPQIITYLKTTDLDYEIHRSLNKEEIGSYVRQRASAGEPIRFYALGGDGTLCDVANGAIGFPNAAVGVFPCGTGNDFVRNFTEKQNFLDTARQVAGKTVSIDLIKCGDTYSINMLNIGADCEVVARAGQLRGGSIAYLRGVLEILPKGPRYRMAYRADDSEETEEDILLCAIANGHFCGGGFKSSPKASLNDGNLDVLIARPVKGFKLMKLLAKYRMGTHLEDPSGREIITHFKTKSFKLRAIDKVNVSVDGEVFPFTEAEITSVPGAINFIIPDGSEML